MRHPATSRRRFLRNVAVPVVSAGAISAAAGVSTAQPAPAAHRCGFWIDLASGEPVAEEELLSDLASVRVVYLGERHTVLRHHELEAWIVTELAKRRVRLVLALEPMEAVHQPALDRYAKKAISFEALAEATQWSTRWRGYQQYKPVLEAARQAGSAILALNARTETIRQVVRSGGVDRLDAAARRELPAEMQLSDPPYEKLLNLQMMVHMSASPQRVRPMVEAQIARDEAMASVLAAYLGSSEGRGRTAVVVCGAGHVGYGLGTAARVRRRIPAIKERIVLFSESGDVELSPQERAVARPISVSHEQLRELGRPIADYLHAVSLKADH
jgi:uncharacterized iron-regulated protein